MRVSDAMRMDAVTLQLSRISSQQLQASREASTGVRVGAPSDDPIAAAQAARVQAQLDQTGAYRAAIRNARGDVELAESTLASATDIVQKAHDLAMQAINGTLDASARADMATQVDQLRAQLLTMANTQGAQGYLFGGTVTDKPPFDPSAAFTGNAQDRVVAIGPNVSATVSVNGQSAFGANGAGVDVFAELASLSTALKANDVSAIEPSVNTLDTARQQIVTARVDAGLKMDRLDTADTAHGAAETSLATQQHTLVDADPAAAYTRLATLQQSLEQAVSVAKSTLATLDVNRIG
jgi:flagellar hook-associated protein 3 FlgL